MAVKREEEMSRAGRELMAQQQLADSQRPPDPSGDRYAELFDFAPVGFLVLDYNGLIVDINLAAARMLGVERRLLTGHPFAVYVAEPRRRFLDHLLRCRRLDGTFRTELELRPRQGSTRPVEIVSARSASEQPRTFFNTAILDLSERLRAEAERAQRLRDEEVARAASEAKDRFLAVLSHELRTPLTPILLGLGTVSQRGVVPDALAPTLDMIQRNVELEARLVDDLLDVTRIIQNRLSITREIVDVHLVLRDVVELCSPELREAGLTAQLELAAPEHHVHGDPVRLRQVFWNLLRNSVRHTPLGGRVTVRSVNEPPHALKLVVSDTGDGIPRSLLGRIFELFEQGEDDRRRNLGLGLGLAICKGVVAAHGGRITAESEGPGRGATFTVALGTAKPPRPALSVPRPEQPLASGPLRVLVVEDNRDNAAAMAELLRVHGYSVQVADSVQAALRASEKGFDVLVSDIGLPDGSGQDLMRQLRARGSVRGIAFSGYGTAEDVRRSAEAGFARHLTKPIDPDQLIEAIDTLIRERSPGRSDTVRHRSLET